MSDGGTYTAGNNSISKEIKSLLGNNHVAVLIVTTRFGGGAGKYQLRHGSTAEWSTGDNNDTWGFTYLAFRKSDTNTGKIVLVPIKNKDVHWHVKIASGNVSDLNNSNPNLISETKKYLDRFCKNLFICKNNNAIRSAFNTKIKLNESTKLPVCNIKIYTPGFDSWMVNGHNLLSYASREKVIELLGKDVCGKLLNGSISSINAVDFYKSSLDNKETSLVNFDDLKNLVDVINSLIKNTDINNELMYLQEKGSNTKGVYWTSGSQPKVVNNYYSSTNTKLSADGKVEGANLWLTNDKDGFVFADVNITVTAEFND